MFAIRLNNVMPKLSISSDSVQLSAPESSHHPQQLLSDIAKKTVFLPFAKTRNHMRHIEQYLLKGPGTVYRSPETTVVVISEVELICESAVFENYEEEDFVW